MARYLVALALVALSTGAMGAQLIWCERLINVTDGEVLENHSIRVEGDTIASIAPGRMAPADGDTVIEVADGTCMPGLIDMHVHLTSEQSPTRFEDQFRFDPAESALAAVPFAERTLMAGFTTVRDLGSSHNLGPILRDAIAKGQVRGPRVIAAGKSLATTGGHADPTNGRNAELLGDPGPKEGVVNSPSDARKAVRQRYKEGADLIKITATGGVLSQASSGQNPQFTDEELAAIVAIARDYGFKVAAHAHGTDGMKRAVIAGVDSIEHGTYMDREVMQLMKRNGTAFVPTIIAGKFVAEKAEEEGYFSDVVRPKAKAIGPVIADTFARAYRDGVKIVFGTDSGVSPHGDNWKEFVYMVEGGMPPMEAIQSATVAAAELLGTDELGVLLPGKKADIVAMAGNPVSDIRAMGQPVLVMKDGVIYKRPD